ncbi:MAG: 3-oxoacyl-ACP synthase III family protein [Acidimicrobiia bacterium]
MTVAGADPVAVAGVGFAVPDPVRGNDDPIFDWIKAHAPSAPDPFQGYDERRVLPRDQDLADIMVPAARAAIADAGLTVDDIDVLVGFASLDPVPMPNPLALVHQKLGLLPRVPVIPVGNDYANFLAGISIGTALVETDRARNVLVVCGSDWTRFVDYHSPQCIAAADGAGAAVVRRSPDASRYALVDTETITESALYGAMYMGGDEIVVAPNPNGPTIPGYDDHQFTWPYFHITSQGHSAFFDFGQKRPPAAVAALLARNGIAAADVTVIAHQASSVLLGFWQKAIGPGAMLDTIAQYADPPQANIPITLAARYSEIGTRHLVLLALGVEFSTTAMLLTRGA